MHQIIDGTTKLTCLLGYPVSHSISPRIHNTAFKQLNLNYIYLCFEVDSANLKSSVEGLRSLGARGFNLTMPNKIEVCDYVDSMSDTARLCGSINTVVNDAGILTGHNTDGIGYIDALSEEGLTITDKHITLLGDGGAAKAIAAELALSGAKSIDMFCRTPFKLETEAFVARVKKEAACNIQLLDIGDMTALKASALSSDLITNATPLGMGIHEGKSIIADASFFENKPFVSDIIYKPAQTALLKLASSAGCKTSNGLGMLIYQGVHAFELWTGEKYPQNIINALKF